MRVGCIAILKGWGKATLLKMAGYLFLIKWLSVEENENFSSELLPVI